MRQSLADLKALTLLAYSQNQFGELDLIESSDLKSKGDFAEYQKKMLNEKETNNIVEYSQIFYSNKRKREKVFDGKLL